jgi:hypothetical protein
MLVLADASSNAGGMWVRAGGDSGVDAYVKPTGVRSTANLVKMSVLFDYQTHQVGIGALHLSVSKQIEYDCKNKQSRVLHFSWHSENMGAGEVVFSCSPPAKWRPVAPGSTDENLWKYACGTL